MPKVRKSHPPSLKAKVAVEAIKAHKTAAQIAQMFGVHPTQVGGWKKQALAGLPDIFGNGREQVRQQSDQEKDELYKQIGQLKVELDFLKNGRARLNRTPAGPETLGICTLVVPGGMAVTFLVFCEPVQKHGLGVACGLDTGDAVRRSRLGN
jgi:transposase